MLSFRISKQLGMKEKEKEKEKEKGKEKEKEKEKDQDKEKPKRVRKDSISSDAKGKGPATSEKSALTAVQDILLDRGVCTFEYLRNNLLIIQIDEEGTSTSFFSC